MKAGLKVMPEEILRLLRLSAMRRHLEEAVRQANETHQQYGEFLLSLTETELDNRLKR